MKFTNRILSVSTLALAATAIGIAVALVGLVGHSALNRRAQLLTESFKLFVLRLTPASP